MLFTDTPAIDARERPMILPSPARERSISRRVLEV
jgi:hypothetical protein